MKHFIFFMVMAIISFVAKSKMQPSGKPGRYETANWKTWMLDDPELIKIAAVRNIIAVQEHENIDCKN